MTLALFGRNCIFSSKEDDVEDLSNKKAILKRLSSQISETYESISKLERAMHGFRSAEDIDDNEEYDLECLIFLDRLDDAFASLAILMDSLGLSASLSHLKERYEGMGKGRGELKMAPWVGEFYNECVSMLQRYEKTLAAYLEVGPGDLNEELLSRLRTVLNSVSQITYTGGVQPKKEAEVTKALHGALRIFFPDATTRGGIAQTSKTYVPDIGIPNLKATIEVKFVSTEAEATKVLGELYEDMHGYEGSEDWTKHFALIYMTKPFLTPEQIKAEVARTSPDSDWEIISVVGAGARVEKKF